MANKSNKNSNQSSQKIPVPLASLPAVLLPWYDREKRSLPWRDIVTPYRTWVSEIMLQQTRVTAVLPYFQRFMETFPTVEALANADTEVLMKLWEGLGYYSRARHLQEAARTVVMTCGGVFPRTYKEVTALPGIGDYTAGAILSIAFGEKIPAVDGNVLRVFARLDNSSADITKPAAKRAFTARVLEEMPKERPGPYNEALMELGALVCLPNGAPKCEVCPLAAQCKGRAAGRAEQLPVKTAKPEKTLVPVTAALNH